MTRIDPITCQRCQTWLVGQEIADHTPAHCEALAHRVKHRVVKVFEVTAPADKVNLATTRYWDWRCACGMGGGGIDDIMALMNDFAEHVKSAK